MKLASLFALALPALCAARFPVTPISEMRKAAEAVSLKRQAIARRDIDPTKIYPEHNFSMPIDHFHNESKYEPHSSGTFPNRYWYDASFYKPGGPVFLLIVGEEDATLRLPIMQKGIIYEMSKAYGGLSITLEHRYFGESFPTPNLSVKNLRFCTTEQALADAQYFAENIKIPGHNISASHTPWILYGGSYAGGFVAFARTLYPDTFFGAISSSGVTYALNDFWEYYEPVRQYGPPKCIQNTQLLTNVVDNILLGGNSNSISTLKKTFGLESLSHNNDFANVLAQGVGGWQGLVWDPAVSDPTFNWYCGNLTASKPIGTVSSQEHTAAQNILKMGGYGNSLDTLTTPLLNYITFVNTSLIQPCVTEGQTLDECYTAYNTTFYSMDGLDQYNYRSWPYMFCTEWGYLQVGSSVPSYQLPLISRTIDINYESTICRESFGFTGGPNTTAINRYGGFNIRYPRLALIGGEIDPWRPVTPLAESQFPWRTPNDTSQPFYLIPGAVHHWDEYGLFPNQTTATLPPPSINQVHSYELNFVKEWLQEYN